MDNFNAFATTWSDAKRESAEVQHPQLQLLFQYTIAAGGYTFGAGETVSWQYDTFIAYYQKNGGALASAESNMTFVEGDVAAAYGMPGCWQMILLEANMVGPVYPVPPGCEQFTLSNCSLVTGQFPPLPRSLLQFNVVGCTGLAPIAPDPSAALALESYKAADSGFTTFPDTYTFSSTVEEVSMYGNALTEEAVDNVLAAIVAAGRNAYIYVQLQDGTNAPPSAAGLANKAIIESWDNSDVLVNT